MALLYPGHVPATVAKDAKYSVVHGKGDRMQVRLVFRLSHTERELLTTDQHDALVKLVNEVKEEHVGVSGGAFYINEHGDVLVPADGEYYFAGTYTDLLEFEFDDEVVSPVAPPGLEPGDPWPGPHVGIPYVLTAGATDIRCEVKLSPTRIFRDHLSSHVGRPAAGRLAKRLSRVKGNSGGKIYINEAREFFAPIPDGYQVDHVYLGPLGDDGWFPAPDVPRP